MGLAPRAAAIAVLLLASGSGGWALKDHFSLAPEAPAVSFTRQALNAHVLYASDMQHPVEFGADQENSFLLWLSERLGHAVHAPKLADLGFSLVGGRLLPAAGQPAAQLMYENPDAERITLYIRSGWPTPPGGAKDGTIAYGSIRVDTERHEMLGLGEEERVGANRIADEPERARVGVMDRVRPAGLDARRRPLAPLLEGRRDERRR